MPTLSKTTTKAAATQPRSTSKPATTSRPAKPAAEGWKAKTVAAGKGKSSEVTYRGTSKDLGIGGRGSIGGGGSSGRKK